MALGRTNFVLFSAAFTVQQPFPPLPFFSATLFLTVWCRTDEKILCRALLCGPLATRVETPAISLTKVRPSKLYQA